jgi:arabinofuranosyltransferase
MLAVSVFLTGAAVALAVWQMRSIPVIVLICGGLAFSNAFIEYATSGLEGSLGYLLVAIAFVLVSQVTSDDNKSSARNDLLRTAAIGAVAAGLFLTRMDFALLLLPPAVFVVVTWRKSVSRILMAIVVFTVPVAIWFIYAFSTYSAWLPNTFTAKRNVEIPANELVSQGFSYLLVSTKFDIVTGVFILSAIIWSLIQGTWLHKSWALGVVAYLAYVVWVGGDFMVGRFLAVPMLVSVLILASLFQKNVVDDKVGKNISDPLLGGVVTAIVGVLALTSYLMGGGPVSLTVTSSERWQYADQEGVSDERGFYLDEAQRDFNNIASNRNAPFELEGFIIPPVGAEFAKSGLRDLDHLTQTWPHSDGERLAVPADAGIVCGLTGSWGIVSGPTVHLIDVCGLTDRFIAMQVFRSPDGNWRPGHFQRPIPDGYEQAIREANPMLVVNRDQARELAILWTEIR